MSQELIQQELLDPLPTLMPKWTALMRHATKNNIEILDEDTFTSKIQLLQDKFKVSYSNFGGKMCLATEALGGFDDHSRVPYNSKCCGEFPYTKASEALRSWKNFIEYKKELYNHIIERHPEVQV